MKKRDLNDVRISMIIPTIDDPMTTQYIDLKKLEENKIELIIVKDRGWRNASRTRNIGAAVAKGDILRFIDDDVEFDFDELLKSIQDFSKENKNAFYWADAPHTYHQKRHILQDRWI